jgi:Flp pilus assembly protein CpaB
VRAVTIQVPNVAAGVGGFVLPGRKVDVLLTVGEGPGRRTTTLLQNVEVLAVDQRLDSPPESKLDPKEMRSVTVLVSPREATMLDLGQSKGTLQLAVRKPDDKAAANPRPLTLRDLRFHQEKPWGQRLRKVLADFAKALAEELARRAPPARAIQVPKGMRAYTIQTPSLGAGQAPGQRVDVLLTVGRGDKHPIDFRTFTLLKGVPILAVEKPRPTGVGLLHWDSAVILLVSPGQAARLTRADRVGALHLACPGEGEEFPLAEGHLLGPELEGEPPPQQGPPRKEVEKPLPPPAPPVRIRILRGR